MKFPRYSIKGILTFVATVAIILALDQNLDSKLSRLKVDLGAKHLMATKRQGPILGPIPALQALQIASRQHGLDSNGVSLENETTVIDRILFRRRLRARFLKVSHTGVMHIHGSMIEESYMLTPFETAVGFPSLTTF